MLAAAAAPVPAPLDALLPRRRDGADGVSPGDVGDLAWQLLLRDGVLRPLWGDLAVVTGRPVQPALRAAALRALVPPRAVVGRAGAVWVHADGPVPARFDVLVEPRVRRPSPHPARVPHECALPPDEVVRFGDVRVTSVPRTALDVVRWLRPAEAAVLLTRLVEHAGLDVEEVRRLADQCRDRGAPARLRAVLAAQEGPAATTPAALEPVMRYTSNTPSILRTALSSEVR